MPPAAGYLIGFLLASAVLAVIRHIEKGRGDRKLHGVRQMLLAAAAAIEAQKDEAVALGDPEDAALLKSITTSIAREAVRGGFEMDLTRFLEEHGLNKKRKLGPLLGGSNG